MSSRPRRYPPCSVFISYNHDTTAHIAGRIYERLCNRLGTDTVFKDNESRFRKIGEDFRKTFRSALDECRIVLVIIDPGWFDRRNEVRETGPDVPPDWVRLEVEAALEKAGLAVIPLMVDGADFPKNQKLPPSLADLRYRDGKRIHSDEGFGPCMDDLVTLMEPYLVEKPKPFPRWVGATAAVATVLALSAVGWAFLGKGNGGLGSHQTSTPVPGTPGFGPERGVPEDSVRLPGQTPPVKQPPAMVETGRVLTMKGEEVTRGVQVTGTVHSRFAPGLGITIEMLFDNGGEEVTGPLTCVWRLPKELEPAKSGEREKLNGESNFDWQFTSGWGNDGTEGIPKGAASRNRGYLHVTPFCPLEPGVPLPMGTPTRIMFSLMKPNGTPVLVKEFDVVLGSEPVLPPDAEATANPRVEVTLPKGQSIDVGGWTLDGTIGPANVDWPVSVSIPARIRNVGVDSKESVTSVWLLPEALRPMEDHLSKPSKLFEKAGLPWVTWCSWVFNRGPVDKVAFDAPMMFPANPALFTRENEKPIAPGVYHAKLVHIRSADFQDFLDGKLQKRPLWEKDFSIRVSQPRALAPRPAPFRLQIHPDPAVVGWPRLKAIAFKTSMWTPAPEYGVFMPVRVKNIGDSTIPGLKMRSEIFLPSDVPLDEATLRPSGLSPRKLDDGEVFGFHQVVGPFRKLCLGPGYESDVEIPKGERMSLQTAFYVGKPDGLPNAQAPRKELLIGLRLSLAENDTDPGVVLFSGHVYLDIEWKEHLDRVGFDELVNQLPK